MRLTQYFFHWTKIWHLIIIIFTYCVCQIVSVTIWCTKHVKQKDWIRILNFFNQAKTWRTIVCWFTCCTANCLFTFVFFPVLTWIYLFCAKNCFVLMFRTIFVGKQVNSGENGEKHKSKQTIACHVLARGMYVPPS